METMEIVITRSCKSHVSNHLGSSIKGANLANIPFLVCSFFIMDYCSDIWYAVLASVVFSECEKKSLKDCPGCKAQLKNPILHEHIQLSLLDKMRTNFNEVRGQIITSICSLYDTVSEKLPHSPDLVRDKEIYTNNAIVFLTSTHPDALYWGRYLDENNDGLISELFVEKRPKRKANRSIKQKGTKKVAKTPDLDELLKEILN